MTVLIRRLGRPLALTALAAAFLGPLFAPMPAHAHVGVVFGFGIAPPVYYPPPPVFYPPPVYYPPPPAYYAPPPPVAYAPSPPSPTGQSCYAGPIVCPMERLGPPGRTCWCTDTAGRRVYGAAS